MFGRGLLDAVLAFGRQWWRLALQQLLVLIGLSIVIGAAALVLQQAVPGITAWLAADPASLDARIAGLGTVVSAVVAILSIPFLVAGTGAAALIADAALAGRRARLWRTLGDGFARFLPLLGTLALAVVLVLGSLVLAPLITLIGLLGLVSSAIRALVRLRWRASWPRWPGWRAWGFTAIPFAWCWRLAARAVLMLPAAALERIGPLRAHRVAERLAQGRRWAILGAVAAAVVVAVAVSLGVGALAGMLWGDLGSTLGGGVAELLVIALPVVVAVACYRRAAGPTGRAPVALVGAPAPARRPKAMPAIARVAVLVVVSLVASVVVPLAVSEPAAAAAGSGVIVVDTAADSIDPADVQAAEDACRADASGCTLRGALALAQELAYASTLSGITITFSGAFTIPTVAALGFDPSQEGSTPAGPGGTLSIDDGGHAVVIDGGSDHQILGVTSPSWDLAVSGITFRDGMNGGGFGGALSAGVPSTTLSGDVFDGNTAFIGGGAVFAQALTVSGSTFLDSRASYYNSTGGGAIRATGAISILNSTFSGSAVGDQFTQVLNHGSDVYADDHMTVVNSSFVGFQGGSLASPSGQSTVRNSLFSTDFTGGGLLCTGSFAGDHDLSVQGGTPCVGDGTNPLGFSVVGPLDSSGPVPVFPLTPNGNPAIGAGVDCPATDALGKPRVAPDGCDLGAVEFDGKTTLALAAVPDRSEVGTVTLRATVTTPGGAIPGGTVSFVFDGNDYGPVPLDDPADGTDDPTVAEIPITGLALGRTYAYSASFAPASTAYLTSSAGPQDYTVAAIDVSSQMDLVCADPTAPECTGDPYRIPGTASIELTARVTGATDGTVELTDDAAGGAVVATSSDATVDGQQGWASWTFDLAGTTLGSGLHGLTARYASLDGTHAGILPFTRSVLVLATPTVSLSGGAGGVYGDAAAGAFTVVVSGEGATPTGIVHVAGQTATLDASGRATVDLSSTPVGSDQDLIATYDGDDVYGRGGSATEHYATTAAATTTAIASTTPADPVYGQDLVVTGTVGAVAPSTADPQGTVTVVVDGTQQIGPISLDPATSGDGESTFTATVPGGTLQAGPHSLVARYDANGNFTGSTSAPTATGPVDRVPTTTALVAAPGSLAWGGEVRLTATVDATGLALVPTGVVAFSADGSPLGTATLVACDAPDPDGCAVASLTVSAQTLGIGTAAFTAAYAGATDLAPSAGTVTGYAIAKATPIVTVSGAGGLRYGQSTTYTVAVSAPAAGGGAVHPADGTAVTVTATPSTGAPIALGTVTLADGEAALDVSTRTEALLPDAYTITAAFVGDDHFLAASGTAALTVAAVSTSLSLDSIGGAASVTYGDTRDVTATVTDTSGTTAPEGDVVITWGGIELGRATLSAADDTGTPGVRTVTVPTAFRSGIVVPTANWLSAVYEPAPGFDVPPIVPDDQLPREQVTVLAVEVAVSVVADGSLAQPLTATARVAPVDPSAPEVHPRGTVDFAVTGPTGIETDCGPVNLVDGSASLADAPFCSLTPIVIDSAGSWDVVVSYLHNDPTDVLTKADDSTHRFAFQHVDIAPGAASIAVDAPATVEHGHAAIVHVAVTGIIGTPSGTVWVEDATATGHLVVSDPPAGVALVNGEADLDIGAWLESAGFGSHAFRVYYSAGGAFDPATSASFDVALTPTSTVTTVYTEHPSPIIVGTPVTYLAIVTPSAGTPTGFVNFSRDGSDIGQSQLDSDGQATITLTPDAAQRGVVTAEFFSTTGAMTGSTGTLAYTWIQAPVTVTLAGPSSTTIGGGAAYTALVALAGSGFPYLTADQLPATGPAGTVTISDGAGATCEATLSATSAAQSTGSCVLPYTSVGNHFITAVLPALGQWAGGISSVQSVNVAKGVPALTVTTPSDTLAGLATIPVQWSVDGPTDGGTVSLLLDGTTVCTSASLVGSCDVPLPDHVAALSGAGAFTLQYGGSPLWQSGSTQADVTVLACIPFAQPTSDPAGGGTAFYGTPPNCGGGTGFLAGTTVNVYSRPSDGYTVSGFDPGGFRAVVEGAYTADQVAIAANGLSGTLSFPATYRSYGITQAPIAPVAQFTAECTTVRFRATGAGMTWRDVFPETASDCGQQYTVIDAQTVELSYRVDSVITVGSSAPSDPHQKFYGWDASSTPTSTPFASEIQYRVEGGSNLVIAHYGPVCYQSAPTVVQPAGGTITLDLPAPNCADPQTGVSGYAYGTPGTAQLVDTAGETYQSVSSYYASNGSNLQRFDDYDWVANGRTYFQDWQVGGSRWIAGAATTQYSTVLSRAGTTRVAIRPLSFTLGETPFTIGASYGQCFALTTVVAGASIQHDDGAPTTPGAVTVNTPGNCPIGASGGLYEQGTTVSLTATPATGSRGFIGWSGVPVSATASASTTVSFPLDADVTATAAFGNMGTCRELEVTSVPAGALALTTSFSAGANVCGMFRPNSYDADGANGNGIEVDATPATADAQGAEIVYAYSTYDSGNNPVSSIWTRSPSLDAELHQSSQIVAYACEFVQIGASVVSPDGTPTTAGASNVDRSSQDRLGDFLATQDGNCSIGADPKSGYGDYAWTVGTRLTPLVTADPAAYEFLGWSGDVSGIGETPDQPLDLVGAGSGAPGSAYQFRVTARFQAICHTLDTTTDADKIEVITAPNCPGMDPSKHLYLGGTPVVIHATDQGDVLFRNWSNSVDSTDPTDGHWASVVMTSDRKVVPYFSEKSAGEYITSYGTQIGDGMAIGAKVMVGVAAAALSTYAKTLISKVTLVTSAIGYIAQGLEAVGVHGSVIDGMKDASQMMNDMVNLLFAPLDCITAWSAGGTGTALYAAQNLVGQAIVEAASAGAQQPDEDPATTIAKLKAAAASAKESADPAIQAAQAINGAKTTYEAGQSSGLGIDFTASAADAWGSESSTSVFTSCMSGRAGSVLTSIGG